jgi:hypothetical protein
MSRRNEVDSIKQSLDGLEKGSVRDFAKPSHEMCNEISSSRRNSNRGAAVLA